MGGAKSYIDSHGLRDFFLTQDWRAILGDVPQRIVDSIINNNPKHIFLDDGIVILRDSTGGIESSNVVAAILSRESPECDEVFGN
jgi:type IV secretory pathway VirB4 component